MRQKIANILLLIVVGGFLLPQPVHAQAAEWTNTEAKRCVYGYNGISDVATIQGLECLVGNILATIMTVVGIAAFVMFLIGSFRYLTAGTNSKGVEGGKNAISFAIVGIVVALLSLIILRFISDFTGVDTILNFKTQINNVN